MYRPILTPVLHVSRSDSVGERLIRRDPLAAGGLSIVPAPTSS